ncbi:MAG: SDR family oxidoreductase [Oscillospiraceae bacterium]|nr:SDR family oxidoreductase [Oscillospiraceae bacterium]
MKTAVITGSTRGLGLEMAKRFRAAGWNLVLNGVNPERLDKAVAALRALPGAGAVEGCRGSVESAEELQALADFARERFGTVEIWINNAGVNQPMKPVWELSEQEIDAILNIDLRGAVLGSRLAVRLMEGQPEGGFVYNLEGYGSNDAMMLGLNMYGTSKRAVTHFTVALAKELEERGSKVKAGRLSPGIMITDFTVKALGGKESIALPEKTKKVYNILGDYPDVVAEHLVKGMLANTKNNAHIEWLTSGKAAWRFMTAAFNKRDFFAEKA